jgi:murein DD-endopeptidase MepM/ murein hydrolase activator NlpD
MGVAALLTALVLHMHAQHQLTVVHPVWPAQGTITSPFGRDGARWHPGIDIGTLRTLTIRAAVPGVVETVGYQAGFEGYGQIVLVRSRGYEELYGHLSAYRVHAGQRLWAGERIATAGCTGWCTGTHLHFEVRRHGVAVSPLATVLQPLERHALRPHVILVGAKPSPRAPRVLASVFAKPLA